ncbi:MAG: hypothetical protein PHP08_02970 [Candidatus Dojkabacteria bacterium]|nr:hypothetical protein [Candidatus Dojkabacteria bacterium]
MSNKFVSTDPMDTVKTMESTGVKPPDVVEVMSVEIPAASHSPEVAPIEELAGQRTSPTFTAQNLKELEKNTIPDNGNTLPGAIVNQDWLTGLLEKSRGNLGPDIRAISKN